MRSIVRFSACIFFLSCLAFAAKNPADYPLKVTVVDVPFWSTFYPTSMMAPFYRGTGHGNVDDGVAVHGFDFSYECGFRLERTIEGQAYPGKWVKPQSRLKLLTGVIGEKDFRECELKTSLREEVYILKSGRLATVSQQEYQRWRAEEKSSGAMKDLSAYPVMVRFLEATWNYDPSLPSGRFQGNGRGNVYDRSVGRGFEFTYDCSLRLSPGRTSYHAKWLKPEQRLEVLIPKPGTSDQFRSCTVETALKDDLFPMPQGRTSAAGPQQEYRSGLATRTATSDGAAMTRLSVISFPAGGDIEVDGKFMGNTPSTLSLPVGEHQIVVRKSGFQTWERKIQLASGDIRLNAELQVEKAK